MIIIQSLSLCFLKRKCVFFLLKYGQYNTPWQMIRISVKMDKYHIFRTVRGTWRLDFIKKNSAPNYLECLINWLIMVELTDVKAILRSTKWPVQMSVCFFVFFSSCVANRFGWLLWTQIIKSDRRTYLWLLSHLMHPVIWCCQ